MDWQDQLRRLDKQLSEGAISAQDYRRLRDELLAEASAPAQSKGYLWSSARPDDRPAPAPEDADDTQVVEVSPNGAVHTEKDTPRQTPPEPAEDPDTTATVSAETVAAADQRPPTFPPRPPQLPVAPPPMTGLQPQAPWSGQVIGEEVFANAKPPSRGPRVALVVLVLLVVLGGAGGAVWYFAIRSEEPPAAQQSDNRPSDTERSNEAEPTPDPNRPPAEVANALTPLPGTPDPNSGTISAQRADALKLVHPDEVTLAAEHGVTDVIFRGSTNGSVGHALLVLATPYEAAATELTDAEQDFLRDSGFAAGEELSNGLPVLERSDDTGTVYRVVYTSGRYTVRLGVAQRDGNPAALREQLETAATAVAEVLPAQ